jgi:uncharacterized protein (DUF1800 family)
VGDPSRSLSPGQQLGQDLMAPPNVKGWPGGEHGSTPLLAADTGAAVSL